ncbi:hypothetical protein [Magnetovibrio sp.]|uniref:hypothetical protein n=1 Tax=Magnetovibrio sp. TaxID=2024836 RepID=UPI002F933890
MSDTLIVSMRLVSGEFESELKMPFPPKNPVEVGAQVGAWLKMCAAGIEPQTTKGGGREPGDCDHTGKWCGDNDCTNCAYLPDEETSDGSNTE